MKKLGFFSLIVICVSLYSCLVTRYYYIGLLFLKNVTFLSGHSQTPKERFFDYVEALSPVVLLVILLISICSYGKHHFDNWGWKARCGVFFFAVLGIALDIALFMIWKKFN